MKKAIRITQLGFDKLVECREESQICTSNDEVCDYIYELLEEWDDVNTERGNVREQVKEAGKETRAG